MLYNRYLKAFLEVAETGSFTKASERLHISSTATMKQLDNLEDEVGCKLLSRTHQGARLTEAGNVILDYARLLVSYSEKAESEARETIRKKGTPYFDRLLHPLPLHTFHQPLEPLRCTVPGMESSGGPLR